jgi:hypothetical protein
MVDVLLQAKIHCLCGVHVVKFFLAPR